jgi:hypothetical protein
MVATQTSILFKTPEGDFHLTEHGEFLSYFDAHLHLFEVFLHDNKVSKEEEGFALEGIKTYMSKSVTKIDHFFEKMSDFSEYLKTDPKTLTDFLTSHFMDVLSESQKKITNQELDRLEGPDSFKSITEEILYKVGSILPKSSQFSVMDDLLVIQNKANGQIIKPVGMLVEVKEVQEKAQKEKEEAERLQKEKLAQNDKKPKSETPTTGKESVVTPATLPLEFELSILKEILESAPPKINGKKLDIKSEAEVDDEPKDEVLTEEHSIIEIPEITEETPHLVDDHSEDHFDSSLKEEYSEDSNFDFELESNSQESITHGAEEDFELETPSFDEDNLSLDPSSDLESLDEVPEIESQNFDEEIIQDIDLSDEEVTPVKIEKEEIKPEPKKIQPGAIEIVHPKINSNAFLNFNYINYLQITRSIDKLKSDKNEYNEWISKASVLIKTFISIQANISKESRGEVLDWNNYFENVSHKSGLELVILENFKSKIEILNLTKKFLDITVSQLKKQPENVQKILKTGWPHIVDTFGESPDFDMVLEKLDVVLSKIKDESIRSPIEKILNLAIKNLKQRVN